MGGENELLFRSLPWKLRLPAVSDSEVVTKTGVAEHGG